MVIIGAKGLAKELLTVIDFNNDITNLYFFDNIDSNSPDCLFGKFPIIKSWEKLKEHFEKNDTSFILGAGGGKLRYELEKKVIELGGRPKTLISKTANIGKYGNEFGESITILTDVIITCDVIIGKGTLINKSVILSHDVIVGDYCEISPGARILGRVKIGDFTEIGTNAVVLPNISVGKNCKIGAGAVVTKDILDNSIVAGVPAKLIKKNEE